MAAGGKKDVMQSIALSHIDGNIRNGLQAGRLEAGWDLVVGSCWVLPTQRSKVISICKTQ